MQDGAGAGLAAAKAASAGCSVSAAMKHVVASVLRLLALASAL